MIKKNKFILFFIIGVFLLEVYEKFRKNSDDEKKNINKENEKFIFFF
jgi:hypothetical protein